eukprot:147259-Prorocentrum_minimum.AAC.1
MTYEEYLDEYDRQLADARPGAEDGGGAEDVSEQDRLAHWGPYMESYGCVACSKTCVLLCQSPQGYTPSSPEARPLFSPFPLLTRMCGLLIRMCAGAARRVSLFRWDRQGGYEGMMAFRDEFLRSGEQWAAEAGADAKRSRR